MIVDDSNLLLKKLCIKKTKLSTYLVTFLLRLFNFLIQLIYFFKLLKNKNLILAENQLDGLFHFCDLFVVDIDHLKKVSEHLNVSFVQIINIFQQLLLLHSEACSY